MGKRIKGRARGLLSLFLAVAFLFGMVPNSFAEGAIGQTADLNSRTASVAENEPKVTADDEVKEKIYEYFPGETSDATTFTSVVSHSNVYGYLQSTFAAGGISVKGIRYDLASKPASDGTGYAQFNAFRLTDLAEGEYTLSLKNAAPDEDSKKVSGAPAIYFFKAEDEYKGLNEYYEWRKSFLGSNGIIGRFDFSKAPVGEYKMLTDGNGKDVILKVTEPGDYYLAFSYESGMLDFAEHLKYIGGGSETIYDIGKALDYIDNDVSARGRNLRFELHLGGIKLEYTEPSPVYEYAPGSTSNATTFTSVSTTSGSSQLGVKHDTENKRLKITGIRYDRLSYAYDGIYGHAQYNAFRITGLKPGEYTISFKNEAKDETEQKLSATPAIYFFKAEDEHKNINANLSTREAVVKPRENKIIGYFNFASAPQGRYATLKSDDGENVVVEVTEPGDYYIAFSYGPKALEAATHFRVGNTTETATKAEVSSDGKVDGKLCFLELHLGGIKIADKNAKDDMVLEKIDFSVMNTALNIGDAMQTSLSGEMSNGNAADFSKYNVTYKSSDENVATVTAEGNITAKAKGNADISVSVSDERGRELKSASLDISVYDEPSRIDIDFTQTITMPDAKSPRKTPGYSIVTGGTSYGKLRGLNTGRRMLRVDAGSTDGTMWPQKTDGNLFEINADIPFEGEYSIQIRNGLWYAGAVYSVFIDGEYAGDINNWDGSAKADGKVQTTGEINILNSLHLTKGRHCINFRTRKINSDKGYLLLDTLSFVPLDAPATLSGISANLPEEIAIGEVYRASAGAMMSNGGYYHFGPDNTGVMNTANTFTATAGEKVSIGEFASYSVGKSGLSRFTLTGVAEGECEITFNTLVDGQTASLTKTVRVVDEYLVSTGVLPKSDTLFAGGETELVPQPKLQSGRILTDESVTTTYEVLTPDTAQMDGNVLKALKDGHIKIKIISTFRSESVTAYYERDVFTEGIASLEVTSGGSKFIRLTDKGSEDTAPIWVKAISNFGNELELENEEITVKALTPQYAETDGKNFIPVAVDEENEYADASFEITVKSSNAGSKTETVILRVIKGKSGASYKTAELAAAARENYKKYNDIRASADKSYVTKADPYVDKLDVLYDAITSEGLPRSFTIALANDPEAYYCQYCMCDIRSDYGPYAWGHDPIARPWKIQCPDCKRLFPSNDFGEFYKLGLNEYGEFDRLRALNAHREMLREKGLIDESVTEPGKEHSAQWKAYYGYGIKEGYLYNELYEELQKEVPETLNVGRGLREGETAETWGVDDGMGYVPAKADGTQYKSGDVNVCHAYIAEYLHSGLYYRRTNGHVVKAIEYCSNAYFYTGDKKYGRVAAVLLDRIADFYWQYDIKLHSAKMANSHGGIAKGKILGCIWECDADPIYAEAYDMVFDLYDDPEVLSYIQNKVKNIKMHHAKESPSQIRTNIEDGLLRTMLAGLVDCSVSGNFGFAQKVNASAAVVLDTMPETKEWLDYLLAPGWTRTTPPCLGGGVEAELMKTVDADGQGNEASDYNVAWHVTLIGINEVLENYKRYSAANFFENPKYVQMFYSNIPLMSATYSPQIGDTSSTASKSHWMLKQVALSGWQNLKDPVFAQILYERNGNTAEGLRYADTEVNPERLEDEVAQVIEEYGEFMPKSDIMSNFGFAALRDGETFNNVVPTTASETRRDVWMYFGSNQGHGHKDTLNLGMTAFGLNFMPELGYPEETGTQPNRLQWVSSTLSHNTVMVDEQEMNGIPDDMKEVRGKVKHFDGNGNVQVMDVGAPYVYSSTDEYRRSVVYIKVDDANSYAVDFFRVVGGNDHLYSVHASSNQVKGTERITLVPQADENGNYVGTYAGKNATYIKKTEADGTETVRLPVPGETLAENEVELPVEFGQDPHSPHGPNDWSYNTLYPRGYTWLKNIDRQAEYSDNFTIDFAIKDFNKAVKDSVGLGLRMTVLDAGNQKDGVTTEVSVADGFAPNKKENKNIDKLKYVLIKKTNKNKELDTTFTTVYEPYKGENYIERITELVLSSDKVAADGASARAIKVLHKDGRCDYVFYATDNSVMYSVTDGNKTIFFRGFVGVYTLGENGSVLYSYVNDGDVIGESIQLIEGAIHEVSGKIKSFTDTILENPQTETNKITLTDVNVTSDFDLATLKDRVIIVDNGAKTRSGSFKICSAEWAENGTDIVLDTGRVTAIRSYVDENEPEKGYIYTIKKGQKFAIPMSYTVGTSPQFTTIPKNATTSAGSRIDVAVTAQSSEAGVSIESYTLESAPRGASIDSTTGMIFWRPDSSQVGDNHFAVTARDSDGRESTAHFIITVYGSTIGSSSSNKTEKETTTETPSTPAGGGGGGGAAPTDKSDDATNTDETDTENTETDVNDAPEASGETDIIHFTDLGNYAWAADAINTLADDEIIRGTTSDTYSPANNITRADFASLLVRAFELKSDNTENFADVSAGDYFAPELAIARNTGIVNGIGDNRYAPRNTINRQDMMVIVYRALQKLNVAFGICDEPQYEDFETVASYAREAVSALIGAGLVNGKSGNIAPLDYTTRAEVAVLIKRILDYTKQ